MVRGRKSLVVGELFYWRSVVNSAEVAGGVIVVLCGMMSGACVGSFLVGATASCAVAGCAPGAQRSRSGFRR